MPRGQDGPRRGTLVSLRRLDRMLVTLRVLLADGTERLLSAEVEDTPEAPEALLGRFDRNGELAVGDRETVPFAEVVKVEFAVPEPQSGPTWVAGLQDEDVEAAMDGRFDKPSYEEPS
jgi:hypothetical protein